MAPKPGRNLRLEFSRISLIEKNQLKNPKRNGAVVVREFLLLVYPMGSMYGIIIFIYLHFTIKI